jgi:glutamyl-tRNA synthetase
VHLGNARTALLAWLWARSLGGRFLLRMEDVDAPRVRPGAEERQLEDLARLRLDWDGEVVRQSARSGLYDEAFERLRRAGAVYPCFCSRADIRAAASAPHGPEGARYPGTCRRLDPDEAERRLAAGEPAAWRFRAAGVVGFVDAVHGPVAEDLAAVSGDVVVRRRDGLHAYQLAVVVDDAAQGITHVLRGDDLLPSTARQIALRAALDLAPEPTYAHVAILLGPDGTRLAKRHGAVGVRELLDAGLPAERLVGWLAGTAGIGDGSPAEPGALLDAFALDRLNRDPVVVSEALLPSAAGG